MSEPRGNAAGSSALREYERRRARDEAKIRETWGDGRIGKIAVALSSERQSTTAWKSGAVGESKVGRALDAINPELVRVLHDRRIPGTRANIDHIIVTGARVWVVDAKRYQGKRPRLEVEGGLFRPRVEKLIVGGDRTKLVDGMRKQVALVQEVVGDVPVSGALCFVDADWPLLGGSFVTGGVEVLWPKLLVRKVADEAGGLDFDKVAGMIAVHFPTA